MSIRRWVSLPLDKEAAAQLSEECGAHPFLALLLGTRGISTAEEAADFLYGTELTEDPFSLADMDLAVERVQRAMDSGERIAVFGDYDADGVTATVLLYSYLSSRGADVFYRLPEREGDGYGLHRPTIDRLAEEGAKLIITVDNGIAAADEVAYAREKGIDVVVTDHHQPQEVLPRAVAVVDPHRADCESTFKEYAGVGVAFLLACALEGDMDTVLEEYADLVALGTLADVVSLSGANRVLVRRGLEKLNRRERPGLRALAEVAGAGGKALTATGTVFTLAPRINASGRMASPEYAARLLLCGSDGEAAPLAEEVQTLNVQRQTVEAAILAEILGKLEKEPERLLDRVLVVEGENWHPGVVGIIAARLLERFGKPCIVLSVRGDGTARGSGRSIRGFSLFEALSACSDVLTAFGGHELAAGASLKAEDIPRLRERINAYAAQRFAFMPVPELTIDIRLRPSQVGIDKLPLLEALEPCGAGNPAPLFALMHMRLDAVSPVGGGKHLRLSVSRDGTQLTVMRFRQTADAFPVECGTLLNLAVSLERNEYNGTVGVSLIAKDIRIDGADQEQLIEGVQLYEKTRRGEPLTAEEARRLLPSREETAALYRYLRQYPRFTGTLEQLAYAAPQAGGPARVRVSLEALGQAQLLETADDGEFLSVRLLPVQGKADLQATPVMRRLQQAAEGE